MTKISIADVIEVRGRYIKMIGGPIITIPENHTCVISGFYIKNKEIIHNGELYFKPQDDENPMLIEIIGNVFINSEE